MKTEKFTILTDSSTTTVQTELAFSPRKPLHHVEINVQRDVLATVKTPKEAVLGRKMAKPKERKRTKEIFTQTDEAVDQTKTSADNAVTAADLTGDSPSESYWKKMAETKSTSLNNALEVNRVLSDKIKELEEELKIKNEMLEEARAMADVIKELVGGDC